MVGFDIMEIHNLLGLYPHVVDDESQYHRVPELFTADAIYDASRFGLGRHRGIAAIIDYLAHSPERAADPDHPFAHNLVDIHVHDLEAASARAISRCLAVYRDGRSAVAVYHDKLEKTAEGWRIAERVMTPLENRGGH